MTTKRKRALGGHFYVLPTTRKNLHEHNFNVIFRVDYVCFSVRTIDIYSKIDFFGGTHGYY